MHALGRGATPARLAAVDAPNVDAFGLVTGLKTFTPTRQVDRSNSSSRGSALPLVGTPASGR